LCPPRPNDFSVHRHLHQGDALLGVFRVSAVSTSVVARVLTAGGGGGVGWYFLYEGLGLCVRRVGPYVWGKAQPFVYIYGHLTLNLIEQP
jgi:hypothetical protein